MAYLNNDAHSGGVKYWPVSPVTINTGTYLNSLQYTDIYLNLFLLFRLHQDVPLWLKLFVGENVYDQSDDGV